MQARSSRGGRDSRQLPEVVGLAVEDGRVAVATGDEVVISAAGAVLTGAQLVCHDAKTQRLDAAEDTLLAAYLIEPGRSGYELDDLAAEYGIGVEPSPPTDEETAALVRRAAVPLRLAPLMRVRLVERDLVSLYEDVELPLTHVLAAMEDAGVKIDTYRMGEITARLSERIEELESTAHELAGEEFVLGSTQQVARVLFETLGLTPGRKGKTGYSTDTKVLQTIRDEHPIVPVIEEWRELTKLVNTYLGPLPGMLGADGRLHTTINQSVAATGRLSTSNPNLQAIPVRTELGREIRSAFVADEGQPARLRRLLADRAPDPRPRVGRAEAEERRSHGARTSIVRRLPRCSARTPRRSRVTSATWRR